MTEQIQVKFPDGMLKHSILVSLQKKLLLQFLQV